MVEDGREHYSGKVLLRGVGNLVCKESNTLISSHIHIYVDNKAAIQRALSPEVGPGQLKRIFTFLDAASDHTVELIWVPGHRGIKGNTRADKLAKDGAAKPGSGWTSLAHARRKAREKALQSWRDRWRRELSTGGYALADRFLPSTQPPAHFRTLSRRTYALVTQCRTGHAFIGEYYNAFVPSEPTECSCGCPLQTRRHIIQSCPEHDLHRHLLRDVVPDLNLADILGTPDGIVALATFIEHTGAFTKRHI